MGFQQRRQRHNMRKDSIIQPGRAPGKYPTITIKRNKKGRVIR